MKQKRVERVERRRQLVEINLAVDTRARGTWPPRPKLSSAKRVSTTVKRVLGLH
jgi:hypothetical protein